MKITECRLQTNKARMWSIGGMTLAGENASTREKPCHCEHVASRLGRFTSGEKAPDIHCIGSLTGHNAGHATRANSLCPYWESKEDRPAKVLNFHPPEHNRQGKNHV
jgi:hypothetical protein